MHLHSTPVSGRSPRLATLAAAAPLLVLMTAARPALAALVLNEFQASNLTTIMDEVGEFEDWIEVLNTGPASVDLTAMYLTDNLLSTTRWAIPPLTLDAGERVLFWCDGEVGEGPLHTNFRLERDLGAVGLFHSLPNGNGPVDTLSYQEQVTDRTYGRFPDGTGGWRYLATPTPNAANVNQGNIPPLVSDTRHTPSSPDENQPVTITSRMRDMDGTLIDTRLFYSSGAGFISLVVFDDGLHGDGAAGDRTYGAQVPGFPGNTTVRYYMRARDDSLAQTFDPVGAPGVTYQYVVAFEGPPLFVNELMASNLTTIADEFGQFDDWAEIYNAGPAPINLVGLHLSDNPAVPNKYTFPNVVLGPHDFLLIWCDDTPAQGIFHAPFKLEAENGERLGLFASQQSGYAVIDSVSFGPQTTDVSYGREPDAGPTWRFYTDPSPRLSNTLPVPVDEEGAPSTGGPGLEAPWPNPATLSSAVRFTLRGPGRVHLALYDVEGRLRAVLADRDYPGGAHSLPLGVPAGGAGMVALDLPSGVYFLRLEAEGQHRVRKLHLLR
jgi:hypothetical protein